MGISTLRQLERERLAAIVDSSQDAIISKTIDGIITSWNAAAERLFGWSATEAIGQPITLIIPQDRRAEEQEIIARLRRGERIAHYETVRQRKDGSFLEISLTISPLRDEHGTIVGASKIARDVTEAKNADRKLRSSEARYRSLVEASGSIVFHSNATAHWLEPQAAWEIYTGQTFEQYRGHGWLQAVHPDDRDGVGALMADAVARGVVFHAEGRIWHAPSQSWRWQETRAVPIRDSSGRVQEWIGIVNDVHARKEAEEALRASDRRKDEFLATLAHELRNPLAPIGNSLEILQASGLDPVTVRELATIARRQVDHLVRLVDDLMEVSRITRGIIALQREPMLLGTAIEEAVQIARPLIEEHAHALEVVLPNPQLLVRGDRTRLTQVVANLLNNAAKYTPRGGRIRVEGSRDAQTAVLRVIDNGVGIPAPMLGQIFQMFTQIDRSPDRTQGGLGIGLSLVRRLVELHGGSVEARSEGMGKGSEFIVRLPLALEQAPAATEESTAVPPPVMRRILIADDNHDAVLTLEMLLRELGQDVHTAHDGEEAMTRAAAVRPELVLLDLGMPRLDGFEVARRIRASAWGRDLVLVALTGWGQDEDRRRSRESGFDRHLVKPVNLQALRELLTLRRPVTH